MTLLPPPGERALPLLSGALLALSFPPAHFLLPVFVGLAPLLVFIAQRPPGPAGRWAATRAGLVTGVVYFGVQLYWLAVALVYHSVLAIPAYLGAVLVLAALTAAFAWGVHWARERVRLPLWLLAASFWTALEWVQGHAGPLSFPWLGLGTALAPYPALAGAADVVGARGLTAWLAAGNGLVATAILRYRTSGHTSGHRSGHRDDGGDRGDGDGRSVRRPLAALAVVLLVPIGYGLWRDATLVVTPAARMAVVQPNIPEELKLDRRIAVDTSLRALRTLTRAAAGERLDLVVWPEVALPARLEGRPALLAEVRAASEGVRAPVVLGAYGVGRERDDPVMFNSAFFVDAAGPRGPRYDKRRLVPFVERVPFVDPGVLERLERDGPREQRGRAGQAGQAGQAEGAEDRRFGALGRGRGAPVLETGGGARFGVLICYESIFAPLARRYRADGADFLVNITNDAWYGREPWYARTTALWQHPAHLVLRAIETRTGVARAANTGISMFVDPRGRTYQETPLFEPAVRSGVVYTTAGTTLFVRWGDWLATALVGLAGVVVVWGVVAGRWSSAR